MKQSEKARNLGAVFDANLSRKSHVNSLCSSARYYLYDIHLARKYLTKEAAEKAIHAFVTSRPVCNNSLLYGLPVSGLQKLQDFYRCEQTKSHNPSAKTTPPVANNIQDQIQDH